MRNKVTIWVVVSLFFFTSFLSLAPTQKINWKKIKTPVEAMTAMDELIPHGTEFSVVYECLSHQKADYFGSSGDTLIQYHSPYVSVKPLSMVSRKWMFNFFFSDKIMLTYSIEEGLLGP